MCGLSFYCSTKNDFRIELERSMERIAHRGPDDRGFFYQKIADYYLGFGHNRLSILDLSAAGKQPMTRGHLTLIYNGEIYNHQVLRQALEQKNCQFQGHSDTEILLALYAEKGVAAFSMLKGMFAFILLDELGKKVYLVRDKLGIKPLYYFQNREDLFVSSEIRGLTAFSAVEARLDSNDVFEFFNQGFLYEPATGFKSIKKLLPGHYCEVNLITAEQKIFRFKTIHDQQQATLALKIKQSVNQQIVSDVPLGTFFSGGLDSSILASLAPNNNLFFAQYDADSKANIDEQFARMIADYLKKPLHIRTMSSNEKTVDELMHSVDFVAGNTEELISDYTFFATYQLSQAAQKNNYKVMLSGMGGDELFAGYPRYLILKKHGMIKALHPFLSLCLRLNIFPQKFDKKFERLVSYSAETHWPTAYSRLLGYFSRAELNAFFPDMTDYETAYRQKLDTLVHSFADNPQDKVKLAQYFDLSGFLAHNLMVADKASMLASIELRVPLLDETVVDHALQLPTKDLIKRHQLKYPLKSLLKGLLPKKLIERPKTGFNPPLELLINKIGAERLKSEMCYAKALLSPAAIDAILHQHFAGKANNTYKLWQLLYFSRWLKLNNFS